MLYLSLLFSVTQAFGVANFSGHWMADTGKVSSTLGLSGSCTRVEILIQQTEQQLTTRSYTADCDQYSSTWGPIQQDLNNGKVFEQGVEVGTISADTLLTTSQDGSVQYAYNLKLTVDHTGKPILKTYYGVQNFIGAIVIESDLSLRASK